MEQDQIQNKEQNKNQDKDRDQKTDELHRITVSKGAERALASVVDRINDGFAGGRVNRTQVANWVLTRFSERLDDLEVREIRMEHFDEVAVLETILRQAKESGRVPVEFKGLLQKQFGMDESPKKRPRKALTENVINDDILEKQGA